MVEQVPQVFHGLRAFLQQVEGHPLGGLRAHSWQLLEGFHDGFKRSGEFQGCMP
jgi:hypothetical protein